MCKAVIPYMRKNKISHIVNISSVAGELPIPFQTFYSATKASIESFSAGLGMELKPFGIKVCCVLPGDTKTGFTAARQKNEFDDESYGARINKSVRAMEKDEENGMTPESVAKVICKVLQRKNPKPTNAVGLKYKFFLFLGKVLPKKLVHKILYGMYAK
jgi:short-subunit dehydrogenase